MGKTIATEITKRINEWDPMDLFPLGVPEDEYHKECEMIAQRIQPGMTVTEVATVIRDVFVEMFGDVLCASYSEIHSKKPVKESDGNFSKKCISIAKSLVHYLNKEST